MLVTIIADASFCPEHKVAGYGYWIASERGKHGGGGPVVRRDIRDNVVAEMMAVANALFHAIQRGLVREGDSVLFQTDCMPAIEALKGKRTRLNPQEYEVVEYVRKVGRDLGVLYQYRHVRGHTRRQENRYLTNRLCDRRARKAMREARSLKQIDDLREIVK